MTLIAERPQKVDILLETTKQQTMKSVQIPDFGVLASTPHLIRDRLWFHSLKRVLVYLAVRHDDSNGLDTITRRRIEPLVDRTDDAQVFKRIAIDQQQVSGRTFFHNT